MILRSPRVPAVVVAGLALLGCGSSSNSRTAPHAQPGAHSPPRAPTTAGKQREEAFRALKAGDVDGALRLVEDSLTAEPESSDGHNIRGMVRVEKGDTEGARRDFLRAAELGPDRPGPHLNLGRLEMEQGNSQAAAVAFEKALDLAAARGGSGSSQAFDAALLAGDAWRQFGSSINAKRCYRRAAALVPGDPRAHAGLGIVMTNTGHFTEARESLEKARSRGDDSASTRAYLGLALAMSAATPDEARRARELLEAARKEGEEGSQVYYGLGLACLNQREYAVAETVLKEGLRRYPDVSGLHYTLADVYAATGRAGLSRRSREKSAALAVLREQEEKFLMTIAGNPDDPRRYIRYADWLIARGDYTRALAPLRNALRLTPGDGEARRKLARCEAAREKVPAPARPGETGS